MKERLEQLLHRGSIIKVESLSLGKIHPNPYQPRKSFLEAELTELAQSIQMYGVLQPILVRRAGDFFEVIAGERRLRACKMIGLTTIPAIVQEMGNEKMASVALIENLQRRDLNYLEEALAFHALIHEFDITQEELAFRIGKSQSAIANKLRLLKLPEAIWDKIAPDKISERHARALLKLDKPDDQLYVLRQIYEKELNVRQTEELVENILQNSIGRPGRGQDIKQVSMVIRDARIFLNTIRETVNRAKQTGIDMAIIENDSEEFLELRICIPKVKKKSAL